MCLDPMSNSISPNHALSQQLPAERGQMGCGYEQVAGHDRYGGV